MELQTRESDILVSKWDHLISVRQIDENNGLYTDEVHIQAGLLTFLIWLWAQWFYRHRQSRWLNLLQ